LQQDKLQWTMAGFTQGGGRLDAFGAHHALWVSPEARLTAARPGGCIQRYGENEVTPVIVYPIPESWRPPVAKVDMNDLRGVGWQTKSDTAGLLNAFVRLAKENITEDVLTQVEAFAVTWGPLWICGSPEVEHLDCHWSYEGVVYRPKSPCTWLPMEEVPEFVRKAWQAKAVLDAAALLQNNQSVPKTLWCQMGWEGLEAQFNLSAQRFLLASTINRYLASPGGCVLWITWYQADQPRLHLSSGKGFLSAVWTEIAQLLCQAKGIYHCDECGAFYVREGRKPQRGRKNYCPKCGMNSGYKASKRRSWERNQRLAAEKPGAEPHSG
jgi:DNA-directed RNA polymerase subunit RPC12/RpoP